MISVAVVDDKRDIREGLKIMIEMAEGFRCTQAYSSGRSAIEGIRQDPPDVVLMDIEMADMSGIDCIRALKRTIPGLDILIFTGHTDDEYIFKSLRAGAYGYLTKNTFPSTLLNAIREVRNGGSPMSSYIARRVVSSFNRLQREEVNLSRREQEVLDLLCKGKNYRNIADRLFISTNTVRFHLKNIYKKLQVNSKYEAVIKASRHGIV
ncbi:MAG: response regulator transcription factor [Saprospiraceae bacterium]|nr:response regulator transcription factor [Saprospiraceae bacterium]MCB0626749.1 response regulator transcription factor [Saprospiraceae bacterium]MCB0675550.1 response regulator transcription factor [Saprospiraceae bacterium]MCB0684779.1 response regulator transcription factor [Saprospiraceae bacterium]